MISANDFLSQALSLINKNNATEVDFRSAISRAYYSLYHESYRFLQKSYKNRIIKEIEFITSRRQPHLLDTKEFRKKVDELDSEYIGHQLRINKHQLILNVLKTFGIHYSLDFKLHRDKRNTADYELDINITYDIAKYEIEYISELIKSIKNL